MPVQHSSLLLTLRGDVGVVCDCVSATDVKEFGVRLEQHVLGVLGNVLALGGPGGGIRTTLLRQIKEDLRQAFKDGTPIDVGLSVGVRLHAPALKILPPGTDALASLVALAALGQQVISQFISQLLYLQYSQYCAPLQFQVKELCRQFGALQPSPGAKLRKTSLRFGEWMVSLGAAAIAPFRHHYVALAMCAVVLHDGQVDERQAERLRQAGELVAVHFPVHFPVHLIYRCWCQCSGCQTR